MALLFEILCRVVWQCAVQVPILLQHNLPHWYAYSVRVESLVVDSSEEVNKRRSIWRPGFEDDGETVDATCGAGFRHEWKQPAERWSLFWTHQMLHVQLAILFGSAYNLCAGSETRWWHYSSIYADCSRSCWVARPTIASKSGIRQLNQQYDDQ